MKDEIKNWHATHAAALSVGEKTADIVAKNMGSWRFIIIQTIIVGCWIGINLIAYFDHWDPYPFILLNLLFSTQAAYAAPIIMMSQNRQAERDRVHAELDYATNKKAEKEIEELQIELARIENQKLDKIITLLQKDS